MFEPYRTKGKILSVKQFGALVELDDSDDVGLLHISKISERFVSDVNKFLIPGEEIWVDIIDKKNDRIELSILDIPNYRNVGANGAEDFDLLAEKLPGWINEMKGKNKNDN